MHMYIYIYVYTSGSENGNTLKNDVYIVMDDVCAYDFSTAHTPLILETVKILICRGYNSPKISKVVKGDPKPPFSIATTPTITTPFPGLLHFTFDTYLIFLSVKQGSIKYHF